MGDLMYAKHNFADAEEMLILAEAAAALEPEEG